MQRNKIEDIFTLLTNWNNEIFSLQMFEQRPCRPEKKSRERKSERVGDGEIGKEGGWEWKSEREGDIGRDRIGGN